jgi:hypothetical protein
MQFAEVTQKEITPALANIWAEQLRDIPAEQLERCFDRLMKSWTSGFLPVPGNVRAIAKEENAAASFREMANQRQLEAKQAALEHQAAISYAEEKKRLLPAPAAYASPPAKKPRFTFRPLTRSLDEQKKLLRAKGFTI